MVPVLYEVAIVDFVEEAWASVEISPELFVDVQLNRLPVGVQEGDLVCFRSPKTEWIPNSFRLCPEDLIVSNPRALALTNNRRVQ